jgi:hypothetical protein
MKTDMSPGRPNVAHGVPPQSSRRVWLAPSVVTTTALSTVMKTSEALASRAPGRTVNTSASLGPQPATARTRSWAQPFIDPRTDKRSFRNCTIVPAGSRSLALSAGSPPGAGVPASIGQSMGRATLVGGVEVVGAPMMVTSTFVPSRSTVTVASAEEAGFSGLFAGALGRRMGWEPSSRRVVPARAVTVRPSASSTHPPRGRSMTPPTTLGLS